MANVISCLKRRIMTGNAFPQNGRTEKLGNFLKSQYCRCAFIVNIGKRMNYRLVTLLFFYSLPWMDDCSTFTSRAQRRLFTVLL
jgi:hypothetical protein